MVSKLYKEKEVLYEMKRLIIGLTLFLVCFNLVAAANVGYVLKDRMSAEANVVDVFNGAGLNVEMIYDSELESVDFNDYDVLFIGDDRLRNVNMVPEDKSLIAVNGHYGEMFGFTNSNGISKISSSRELSVKKDGQVMEVYNKPWYVLKLGYPAYYLSGKAKMSHMDSVAMTNVGYDEELGDVVSYYDVDGVKKCFFGLPEVWLWNSNAKNMFGECVEFVADSGVDGGEDDGEDEGEGETGDDTEGVHDVMIDENLTNGVNGLRVKDLDADEYLIEEVSELKCFMDYRVDYRTINTGDFTEDVTFNGMLANFSWDSIRDGLESGESTFAGSKTINVTFEPGFYELDVIASIDEDDMPDNNMKSRMFEVVC